MGIERVINEVSSGTEGVSILFHTGKSLERGFAIVLTKKKRKKKKKENQYPRCFVIAKSDERTTGEIDCSLL